MTTTTTSTSGGDGRFPKKVLGMYVLLADDTEDGFHSDADWEPKLFEYQQKGANVLVNRINEIFNRCLLNNEGLGDLM
jgi:hypothetical protein